MLDKKNRLKKRKAFAYMYSHGKHETLMFLTLITTDNKYTVPKIGFSISKKVGKAHLRNLIKRRMRSIIREILPTMKNKYNYIFVAKAGIDTLSYIELKNNIIQLILKADKFKENNENYL